MSAFLSPTIAEMTPVKHWPDGLDATILAGYLTLIIGLPLLGYVFMFLDVRRYLRSLRRTLVLVAQAVPTTPNWAIPSWALRESPPCLAAFDLQLPCSEQDVLTAYRKRAKSLHPDRGGDLQKFLRLQQHFEQAMHLVRSQARTSPASIS